MKAFITIMLVLTALSTLGKSQSFKKVYNITDSSYSFTLSLTTYNHAEQIFTGITTYSLTDSFIKITKVFFGDNKSKIIYSRRMKKPQKLIVLIDKVNIDSLKDFYFNMCVLPTSGNEYVLNFANSSLKKRISLHHYYLKQLDEIIQIINSYLPKKYKCHYLQEDTKQDCTLKELLPQK